MNIDASSSCDGARIDPDLALAMAIQREQERERSEHESEQLARRLQEFEYARRRSASEVAAAANSGRQAVAPLLRGNDAAGRASSSDGGKKTTTAAVSGDATTAITTAATPLPEVSTTEGKVNSAGNRPAVSLSHKELEEVLSKSRKKQSRRGTTCMLSAGNCDEDFEPRG